jgi:hypothetical protein
VSVAPIMIALFKQMQWKRICYVGSNEVYGQGLLATFLATLVNTDTTVQGLLFTAVASSVATVSAQQQFQTLLNAGCRVFVLHCISKCHP